MLMRQTMVSSHVPQDAGQRPAHPGHQRSHTARTSFGQRPAHPGHQRSHTARTSFGQRPAHPGHQRSHTARTSFGQRPAHPGHQRSHTARTSSASGPRTQDTNDLTRRAHRRPAACAPRTPTALTRRAHLGQRPAHPGHRRRSHGAHISASGPRTQDTDGAHTARTSRPAARAPRTPTALTRRTRRRPAARAPRAKIPKSPTCNRIQLLAYPMIARLSSMIESSVCHHAGVVHNNIREEL
jgi:hypothetical protein